MPKSSGINPPNYDDYFGFSGPPLPVESEPVVVPETASHAQQSPLMCADSAQADVREALIAAAANAISDHALKWDVPLATHIADRILASGLLVSASSPEDRPTVAALTAAREEARREVVAEILSAAEGTVDGTAAAFAVANRAFTLGWKQLAIGWKRP
jgi:hypothetical protein